MHFIRLPKPIDIEERVLPDLVADWMDAMSVLNSILLSSRSSK